MDVATAVSEYLFARRTLARTTRDWYEIKLNTFLAWCDSQGLRDLDQLKPVEIRRYQDFRANSVARQSGQPLKATSLHSDTQVIKTFIKWCYKEELIDKDFTNRIELPKKDDTVIEVFDPEQIKALFEATAKERSPALMHRNRAILALLLDTGMRASELCSLTVNNIIQTADESYIRVMGKGRKEREVGLGAKSRSLLRRYVSKYRTPHDDSVQQVFLSRTGEPLTRKGLEQMIEHLGQRAHIHGVRCSPHTFRHTYALTYIRNGGDVSKLSRLMGHEDISITSNVYLGAMKHKDARQGKSVLDSLY